PARRDAETLRATPVNRSSGSSPRRLWQSSRACAATAAGRAPARRRKPQKHMAQRVKDQGVRCDDAFAARRRNRRIAVLRRIEILLHLARTRQRGIVGKRYDLDPRHRTGSSLRRRLPESEALALSRGQTSSPVKTAAAPASDCTGFPAATSATTSTAGTINPRGVRG